MSFSSLVVLPTDASRNSFALLTVLRLCFIFIFKSAIRKVASNSSSRQQSFRKSRTFPLVSSLLASVFVSVLGKRFSCVYALLPICSVLASRQSGNLCIVSTATANSNHVHAYFAPNSQNLLVIR